jgi:hypothetical protein
MGRFGAWALILQVSVACGCGMPGARGAQRPLPPYGGHARDLFDDGIELAAVSVGVGAGFPSGVQAAPFDRGHAAPRGDKLLRERTQVGDAVVRARVRTVTSKDEEKGRIWQLGFHTVERLAGSGPLAEDFTLELAPTNESSSILGAYENRVVGTTFVAFVREFARPGGADAEGELHFHIAHDAKDEVEAVRSAALREPLERP